MTKGEDRVRVKFNPSAQGDVDRIKQRSAELIDQLEQVARSNANPELRRLIALAQTALEESAMWAVKALTFKDEDYGAEKTD